MRSFSTACHANIFRVRNLSPSWKNALPYFGTLLIFALIFWRIPIAKVGAALEQAPVLKFFGVFLPFCAFYWLSDSLFFTLVLFPFNPQLPLPHLLPLPPRSLF